MSRGESVCAALRYPCCGSGTGAGRHAALDHRRHPEGDVARVLAEHSRRRRRAAQGARRRRSSGAGRCAKTIATPRSPRSRASSAAASPASRSRRSTRRRCVGRSPMRRAAKIPVVIFDSGLKGSDYVSFVATDNRKGGRLGGERLIEAMQRQRQGRPAALRRRARQHRPSARKDFSTR